MSSEGRLGLLGFSLPELDPAPRLPMMADTGGPKNAMGETGMSVRVF
jgi:hypothetical protein